MAIWKRKNKTWHPSLAALVEEALGAVLSGERLREVVDEALEIADLPEIPETAAAIRVFVEGPLFSALSHRLDMPDALEVLSQLRRSLDHALRDPAEEKSELTSDVRMRRMRLDAVPSTSTVLVATKASLVVFLLQDMLGDDVEILPVSSEEDLVDRLQRMPRAVLLVVDRRHPCVGPSAAGKLEALIPGSQVVWWCGQPHEQTLVEGRLGAGCELVSTREDLPLADLGQLCQELLG